MPRRNPKREQALAEAKSLHRAAGKKVSYYEGKGVRLRKNNLDPRTSAKSLESMTLNELRSYSQNLRQFNSRSTSFVAADEGMPVRTQVWRYLKRMESKFNRTAQGFESKIGDYLVPTSGGEKGQTIRQRIAATTAEDVAKSGQTNRIFANSEREISQFTSEQKVWDMIDQLRHQSSPQYMSDTLRRRLNSMEALLKHSGNEEFIEQLEGMDQDALAVALEYSPLGSIAQERFYPGRDTVQKRDAAYEARTGEQYADEIKRQIQVVLDWSIDVANGKAPKDSKPGRKIKPKRIK